MASCVSVAVQTLFGSSTTLVTTDLLSTITTTETFPAVTSTITIATQTCVFTIPILANRRLAPALGDRREGTKREDDTPLMTCVPEILLSTVIIPGETTTFLESLQVILTIPSVVTFPTQTTFTTSCATSTSSTSAPPPPGASSSASPPAPSALLSPSNGSFFLSTPPPTTFTTATSFITNGGFITTQILLTSQPPVSTIFSSSGGRDSDDVGPLISGAVGSVIGLCVVFGVLLWVWRRKKMRELMEYENEVQGTSGRRLELDVDDNEHIPYDPYGSSNLGEKYHDGAPSHRPMSTAEHTSMFYAISPVTEQVSPRTSENPSQHHAFDESGGANPRQVDRRNTRYSSLSTSSPSLYSHFHQPLASASSGQHQHHVSAPFTISLRSSKYPQSSPSDGSSSGYPVSAAATSSQGHGPSGASLCHAPSIATLDTTQWSSSTHITTATPSFSSVSPFFTNGPLSSFTHVGLSDDSRGLDPREKRSTVSISERGDYPTRRMSQVSAFEDLTMQSPPPTQLKVTNATNFDMDDEEGEEENERQLPQEVHRSEARSHDDQAQILGDRTQAAIHMILSTDSSGGSSITVVRGTGV